MLEKCPILRDCSEYVDIVSKYKGQKKSCWRRWKRKHTVIYYEIMHGERKVAEISTRGEAVILSERFMTYDLYLEEDRDGTGND